ncbi:alginate lyase family protein [Paraglaciecola aquimarina]|uniref:Alginate lyase family protein n=1 Tax=Paraglaciecola algarum TaxID=3050085 RepID=A0ABS9D6P1_9ALTE|nr:alginate lyase family protein [Paraglaciecola sp. G1-23]MCF2948546.1 alginate lyase family protein [Paraglaciecola sp. G1-23]
MSIKHNLTFYTLVTCSLVMASCQSTGSSFRAQSIEPNKTITVNQEWLDASYDNYQKGDVLLNRVVKSLVSKADKALTQAPVSVLDKTLTPPSGNKKDYMSVGPYWWPNPDTPNGMPWIKKDGQVNPSSKTNGSDKTAMNEMLFQVSDLALAYHYTKNKSYAAHAAKLINTWFLDPATGMNPSLDYGQAIPGAEDGRKYGIIETRWFMRLIDDVSLISESGHFPPELQLQFKHWISQYLDWLLTNKLGIEECNAHNNHGTYCEAQVANFALYIGKFSLAKKYIERVFQQRLEKQIDKTGAQPEELSRTRPLHYSLFNLEAYFYVARVGDHLGLDMWHYQTKGGKSLKQAIDFLLPAITQQGYWKDVKHKKMRVGRLFYFLQVAHEKYGENKYLESIEQLVPIVANEDRSELSQCLLITKASSVITSKELELMDPDGKKSQYRCYY